MSVLESDQDKLTWWVYIIETESDTFYTGITNDLENRWQTHLEGKGSKYLRSHKPKAIVFVERQENRSEASKREAEIKKLTRQNKLSLIAANKLVEKFKKSGEAK